MGYRQEDIEEVQKDEQDRNKVAELIAKGALRLKFAVSGLNGMR